jgi:hypothetical protein
MGEKGATLGKSFMKIFGSGGAQNKESLVTATVGRERRKRESRGRRKGRAESV